MVGIFLCCLISTNCDVIHHSAANLSLFQDQKSGLRFAKFVQLKTLYLNVMPFKIGLVVKQDTCLLSCVADQRCVSLNIAKSSSGQYRCELLATDMFRNPNSLMTTANTTYNHLTIKVKRDNSITFLFVLEFNLETFFFIK